MSAHGTESVAFGLLGDALADWRTRTGPTYLRLADALADAIAQGHLGLGSRLPSERALAAHLRVARGTVVAAYDTLRARGIVATRRGSGTVVQSRAARARAHRAPLLSRLVDGHEVPIDLAIGALSVEEAELADISVSLRGAGRFVPAHGYAPLGIRALRAAIAQRYCGAGVPTRPDQVLITTGGQSALSLIAAGLLRSDDRVITEAPTYPAAIEVFIRAGARVEGVLRDHAGPIPSCLEQRLGSRSARLVYVIPTCHNPTGGMMSESRRVMVLKLAREARATVIEDAVLEDLAFAGRAPPSLAALDPDSVISVGSLSKTVWGGLRVGWIRATGETILRLGRTRASVELGSPVLEQAAALQVLERYDELVAARRAQCQMRLETLCGELRAELPTWTFPRPVGGLCVWAELPHGSADAIAQLALRRGVAIASGRTASPGEEFPSHVRLSAGPRPELLREGVARLTLAWQELEAAAPVHEQRVVV